MKKILIFIICICLLTGCNSSETKQTNNDKESEKQIVEINRPTFSKEQKIDNLTIKFVSLKWDGKESEFIAQIINNGKEDVYLTDFDVILKDKNNKEVVTLLGDVSNTLKVGDSIKIICYSDLNLSNVYSFEYKKN